MDPSAEKPPVSKPVPPGQFREVTQPGRNNPQRYRAAHQYGAYRPLHFSRGNRLKSPSWLGPLMLASREYQRRMKAIWRVKSEKFCKAMAQQLNSAVCRRRLKHLQR